MSKSSTQAGIGEIELWCGYLIAIIGGAFDEWSGEQLEFALGIEVEKFCQ